MDEKKIRDLVDVEVAHAEGYDKGYAVGVMEMASRMEQALREAAATGWDTAVSNLQYEDGTPMEVVSNINPYRD